MDVNAPQANSSGVDTAAFRRDGFLGPVRLFTPAQCAFIVQSLRLGSHPPPLDWPKGRGANDRFFYDLATRPALLALLTPLLGKDIVLWGIDVIERDPGQIHPWHTDMESSALDGRFVSVWIGIQNISQESALQVVTRSHAIGKPLQQVQHEHNLRRGEATNDTVLAWARERDPRATLVQPVMSDGDAILFDGRIWHATNNARSEGRRIALLLQYAAADSPVSIADFSGPTWPFRFKEARPPVLVVSGRGDSAANRLVPPPPARAESQHRITTHIQKIEPPSADDFQEVRQLHPILCGSTPILHYLECHYSRLAPRSAPHPPHIHPEETVGIVLDGALEALIDDDQSFQAPRSIGMPSNSILYQPGYQHHLHQNPGDKPSLYLFLAWSSAPIETDYPLVENLVEFGFGSATADQKPIQHKLLFEHPTPYLTKLHAHLTTLQPGAGYEPHVDDYDVAIVLLSGKIETLGRTVEGYSFIFYAAGEPHGMRNVGVELARYVVFEFHAPKRPLRNRVAFQIPKPDHARETAQEFRTFWVGPPLTAYEDLSLTSLVARGQRVLLYSYDKTLRVPDGVELVDANEVLPADRIHEFLHPNGEASPTLHANLFRYEALHKFGGWYCDLDIVLVGDSPPSTEVYLAREDETFVNNAVLRFPPGAPFMAAAAEAARALMTSTQWGASGPKLLTRLVEEHGLGPAVLPWTAAYPLRPTEVHQLFLPQYREELEDRVAGADFVHLWNQIWCRVRIPKQYGPPEGSFLNSLFHSFGIKIAPGARMSQTAVASWFREFDVIADAKRLNALNAAELARALGQPPSERGNGTDPTGFASELELVRWQRDQLLRSTSWRITAPLRRFADLLRPIVGPREPNV